MSDKMLSEEQISAINALPLVEAVTVEQLHANLLVVVVGAGVYRELTVATHLRVAGASVDYNRRAHVVMGVSIKKEMDLQEQVGYVENMAASIPDCQVVIDVGGAGTQFAAALEDRGVSVFRVSWGSKSNAASYFNQRAQCYAGAVRALKNGLLSFGGDRTEIGAFAEEFGRIPYSVDEFAVMRVATKEQHAVSDAFDTICMAFLDLLPTAGEPPSAVTGKDLRDQLDVQLEGRTSIAEVIKDLPLYGQILDRGQLIGKMMSRNLIEVVQRQQAEIERLQAAARTWQSMDTVPTDNTPVLVLLDDSDCVRDIEQRVQHARYSKTLSGSVFGTVGDSFAFDKPRTVAWMLPPDIPS